MSESKAAAPVCLHWLRPRFRLRTLLLATGAIAALLALVVAWLAPYRAQDRAAAEVRRGTSRPKIGSGGDKSWCNSGFLMRTYQVELSGGATDLHLLEGFPFLQQCGVHERELSVEDLQTLAGLHGLTELDLSHCQLPEDAIGVLARLRNLTALDVEGCGIPEATLDKLREQLPELEIHDD